MIPSFDYKTPRTLREACDLLWNLGKDAKVIAGGTDLVIGLRNGDLHPRALIDVTETDELLGIKEEDGMVRIGACVTHGQIASSPVVKKYGPVLSEASSRVGSPQIRNLGTVGGNIVNASPAADTLPPLMVLGAAARVASKEGERTVSLEGLFRGPYETNLKPQELLLGVSFQKLNPAARCGYVRLARREAMAVARMSVAVVLELDDQGRINDLRISVGAVTPRPCRMAGAEAVLRGDLVSEAGLQRAAKKVSEEMIRRSGVRASTAYKAPVVETLFARAFRKAWMGRG